MTQVMLGMVPAKENAKPSGLVILNQVVQEKGMVPVVGVTAVQTERDVPVVETTKRYEEASLTPVPPTAPTSWVPAV